MSDPHFTPQEKHAVNHAMLSVFREWVEDCARSDTTCYVELARRLNTAAVQTTKRLRKP